MRDVTTPTIRVNVAWPRIVALLLVAGLFGCSNRESLPNYQMAPWDSVVAETSCRVPNAGCPCDVPGTLTDCGEVRTRSDSYVTCTQGVRVCGDDGVWGTCAGEIVTKEVPAGSGKAVLALGTTESCTAANPCDPLCRQILDNGVGVEHLPDGLCSTANGIAVCPLCGYSGPVSNLPYATMPEEWQRIPNSCSPADDRCPFDLACVGTACQTRSGSCTSADANCAVDLTLGKPCLDPLDPLRTYHIPLCNRGSAAMSNGTIRIGVDSRSSNVTSCVPLTETAPDQPFPDSGVITFEIPGGRPLEPGTCVDVHSTNSVASADLDLSGSRAFVANFDVGLAECNSCNNGNAVIVEPATGSYSTCTPCLGLQCAQGRETTLRGTLYDPAGRRPVPNAVVYVPNSTVAAFVDGVNCDRCESMVSGSPIAWAKTDAGGHFELNDVPSETPFPLVVQIGRWRRQLVVPAMPSGETRWIQRYSVTEAQLVLTPDSTQPAPYPDSTRRLRLPATQRRCNASTCAGEGDIPKIAVLLGDADPVQCVLRRIGIADSEFTSQSGSGRVQLFHANGMRVVNGNDGFGPAGLLTRSHASGTPELFDYSMLIAPCNGEHQRVGPADYAVSQYASGPSYNSWPDPTASDAERANVKNFVDAGGRLMTTHWLSVDFVHLNYQAPPRANFSDGSEAVPLVSPYNQSEDLAFSDALVAYGSVAPNFVWSHEQADSYNASAPTVYLYGNNLNASGNVRDVALSPSAGTYQHLSYSVDLGTSHGAAFLDWAASVGALSSVRQLDWAQWSPLVHRARLDHGVVSFLLSDSRDATRFSAGPDLGPAAAVPEAQEPCLQGDGSAFDCQTGRTWGESHVGMFQFDAPLAADQKCGRAAVIAGHASNHACHAPSGTRGRKYCSNVPPYSDSNPPPDCDCLTFPSSASAGCGSTVSLTPEELSFEYLLFSASQCIGEPKPPSPSSALPTTLFVRDFEADCKPGEQPVWQLFSWQAAVPDGSRIDFFAATADSQADLAPAEVVPIGVADRSTTTWTAGNHTVDEFLRSGLTPPDVSRQWLRVKMSFVPNGSVAPTLSTWRVVFNCIANQ